MRENLPGEINRLATLADEVRTRCRIPCRRIVGAIWFFAACLIGPVPAQAQPFAEILDAQGDAVVRPTDQGRRRDVDPFAHHPPDLAKIVIGIWQPDQPELDIFVGEWVDYADKPFLRMDVVLAGLFNPPGTLGFQGDFDPFRFGPHPVFGFIELDADGNANTGGEVPFPEYRYLSNAVRFGGIPASVPRVLQKRFALTFVDGGDECSTKPHIERSGEEFHLALTGEEYRSHRVVFGDDDETFEAGEIWDLTGGSWLHRAHGFKDFGGCLPCGGEYMPVHTLRWSHDEESDKTWITTVFPLTNRAANAMRGNPPEREERNDADPRNQASIHEALTDLTFSARQLEGLPPQECAELILGWADTDPQDCLDPSQWRAGALVSTSFVDWRDNDSFFVWTDVLPDALPGDFDGDGDADWADFLALYAFVRDMDGSREDGDRRRDGRFTVRRFARTFSVFDVNYDGGVGFDDLRAAFVPGDFNGDRKVDLADLEPFLVCYEHGPLVPYPPQQACELVDSDFDGDVDLADVRAFQAVFTGSDP